MSVYEEMNEPDLNADDLIESLFEWLNEGTDESKENLARYMEAGIVSIGGHVK